MKITNILLKRIILPLTLISLFSPGKILYSQTQQHIDPYQLSHESVSVHVRLKSPILFLQDLEKFIKKGLGPFGTMGWQQLKIRTNDKLGEDLFSSVGLYMLGLHSNRPALINVYGDTKTPKKTSTAILLPVREQKIFDNFLFKLFLKRKNAGEFKDGRLEEYQLNYKQAGKLFSYAYIEDYVIIAENLEALKKSAEAWKSKKNLYNSLIYKDQLKEIEPFNISLILEPSGMFSLLQGMSRSAMGYRRTSNRPDVFAAQKKSLELYKSLLYGININGKGIYIATRAELADKELVKTLLKVYTPIDDKKELDPEFLLQRNPLFFVQSGLEGKPLYDFIIDYFKELGGGQKALTKLDKKFEEIKKNFGFDIREQIIYNISTPLQILVSDIDTPANRENFFKSNTFLSLGVKDTLKLRDAMDKLEMVYKKAMEEKKKKDPNFDESTEKASFSKKGQDHWQLTIRQKNWRTKKYTEYPLSLRLHASKLYVGVGDFSPEEFLKKSTTENISFSQEKFLLGLDEAKNSEYGPVVVHFKFDFNKLRELLADQQKNFFLAQIILVLKNYDTMTGVSKVKGREVRSWMKIKLK